MKQETDHKEQLLVQLQNKDQIISNLTAENDDLTSALNTTEQRLNELYTEQSRSEVELAQRIDISDKLRTQVRELEKEKRDIHRRYNEQTATFEAERQAFYDNEQHLKSRILSLTHPRKPPEPDIADTEPESEVEPDNEEEVQNNHRTENISHRYLHDAEAEPAEMTSLRLELSTLSTSYSSLQSTLVLLQTQLVDLKRVNNELQEENESYMILLREKTLSGQFDLMRQVGGGSSNGGDDEEEDEESAEDADVGSLRSTARSTLDRVDEEHEDNLERQLERSLESDIDSPASRHLARQSRKRTPSMSSGPRGESLADLPITGPGLDLAAELGRAENKDMLAGNAMEERTALNGKVKRSKRGSDSRKISSSEGGLDTSGPVNDIDALRTEVKSLKDANKALSLYASKIIDRIIAQEGFEHVLAIDYDKDARTPTTGAPPVPKPSATHTKNRPQSVIVGRTSSNPLPAVDTRFNSPPLTTTPRITPPNPKAKRRSLSFDWKSFSIFNSAEKKPDPNLRPLTLNPGISPVTGARKLDNQEDEDDRRERERLNATMKLMGIEPPATQQSPSFSFPIPTSQTPPLNNNNNRRLSFFGTKSVSNSETSSMNSKHSLDDGTINARAGVGIRGDLTQEALERAEAENSLAALDARERTLSAEIARGGNSGFTEIASRNIGGRKSRRSAGGSGSGSTVWSAGMSGGGEED